MGTKKILDGNPIDATDPLPADVAQVGSAAVETAGAGRQEVAAARMVTDPVDGAGAAVPIKYARINATLDGDNVVVAAVGGKKIRVLGYAFALSAAGTVTFQDTAGAPVIHAQFPLAANGGVSYAGGIDCSAFETAVGTGVEINNPVGVDTLGHLTYMEV